MHHYTIDKNISRTYWTALYAKVVEVYFYCCQNVMLNDTHESKAQRRRTTSGLYKEESQQLAKILLTSQESQENEAGVQVEEEDSGEHGLSSEEHDLSADELEQRRRPNDESRLSDEEDDDETLQEGVDNTTMVTSDEFRSLIFEKGYKLFKGQLDLNDIFEINMAKQNVQPSTLENLTV